MQVCITRLTCFINDFLDLIRWEVLATGINRNNLFLANFSSWSGSLAGVSVAAVAGWAATSDSATELASSRIKRSRSDTRNSRSGSVGWLWSTIGAGAVGFSTVSWEASSLGRASPRLRFWLSWNCRCRTFSSRRRIGRYNMSTTQKSYEHRSSSCILANRITWLMWISSRPLNCVFVIVLLNLPPIS